MSNGGQIVKLSDSDKMHSFGCIAGYITTWKWGYKKDERQIAEKLIRSFGNPGILKQSGGRYVLDQDKNSEMKNHTWYILEVKQESLLIKRTLFYFTTEEQVVYCELIL